MKKQLEELFDKNNGYLTGKSIRGNRSLYYQLESLLKNGQVIKVKRGLYRHAETTKGNSWGELCKSLPQGVICLFSAWQYYNLSTSISPVVHLAIPVKTKYQLPVFPPVKLYYWTNRFYETGITVTRYNNEEIVIYNLEKSVCDSVRYRTKIGSEITSEVLKNYLKNNKRNIDKLMKYAENMRISKVLNQYLQVML